MQLRRPEATGSVLGEAEDRIALHEVEGLIRGAHQTPAHGVAAVVTAEVVGIVFVEVGLIVAVEIVKSRDPSAIEDEDSVLIDVDSHWLVESRGVALPGHFHHLAAKPGDFPDFTAPDCDQGVAIGEERDASELHDGLVMVVEWHRNGVHDVGSLFLGEDGHHR